MWVHPGSPRSPGAGHGNPLQYSCLENPWTGEPCGLQSMGSKESDMTEKLTHTHTCRFPCPWRPDKVMGSDLTVTSFRFKYIHF